MKNEKLFLTKSQIEHSLFSEDNSKHATEDLLKFYEDLQNKNQNDVAIVGLTNLENWKFNLNGNFAHISGRFFSINTIEYEKKTSGILVQPEIGLLSFFCTYINDTLHFLVQFKFEPGNINKYQLSPTIQATKSNFDKVHGGQLPLYFSYFLDAENIKVLFDELLPEQGDRYWQKFNRNKIILTNEIKEENNFKWMTLNQIAKFSRINNSINSCSRSVLSLILNFCNEEKLDIENEKLLKESLLNSSSENKGYGLLGTNSINFFNKEQDSLIFENKYDKFKIRGFKITTNDREIKSWSQPLIEESKTLIYNQIILINNGEKLFLWSKAIQPGYIYGFAYNPTLVEKLDNTKKSNFSTLIKELFPEGKILNEKKFIMSEEGGRFFNTQVIHNLIEIETTNLNLNDRKFKFFNSFETNYLLKKGFLGIEARSVLFFTKLFEK